MEGYRLAYRTVIRQNEIYFSAELWLRTSNHAQGDGANDGNEGSPPPGFDDTALPPPGPPRRPPPPPGPPAPPQGSRRLHARTGPEPGTNDSVMEDSAVREN